MQEFIQSLLSNTTLKVLIIVIVLDTIFGILRAIKEKSLNSTIGIDGIIRKVGMLIAVTFLLAIDTIVHLNLIGFIPEDLRNFLNVKELGISEVFNILFIVFEMLSIMKNMILCKLPIPKKFQQFFEKIMKEFTNEINKKKGE